jgi:aspartate carbamoyltransferase catalytic subunit
MPAAELTALLDRADTPAVERPLAGAGVAGLFQTPSEPLETAFAAALDMTGAARAENLPHAVAAVARHPQVGGVAWLARNAPCPIVSAGDGDHENPIQALADVLELRRRFGTVRGLVVTLAGDIAHHGSAFSAIHMLNALGAFVRVVAPPTLLPPEIDRLGAEVFHSPAGGLRGADAVLRYPLDPTCSLGTLVPSAREYEALYGIGDAAPLVQATSAGLAAVIAACLIHVTGEAAR